MRRIKELNIDIKKGDKVVFYRVDGEKIGDSIFEYDEVIEIDKIQCIINLKKSGKYFIQEDLGGKFRIVEFYEDDEYFLFYSMDLFKKEIGDDLEYEKMKYQQKRKLYNKILKQIEKGMNQ